MSGSIFDDPLTTGLLGAAQGFAQAAMPSRLPVPLGAAIGMGAGGFMQGGMQAFQGQKMQAEAQAAQLNNQLLKASMPAKLSLLNSVMGQGGAPFGVPGSAGGMQGGGQAAAMGGGQGAAPNYLLSPQDIVARANFAMAMGQDTAAARLYGLLNDYTGQGYAFGQGGRAMATPGGINDPTSIFGREQAQKAGALGPEVLLHGAQKQQDVSAANAENKVVGPGGALVPGQSYNPGGIGGQAPGSTSSAPQNFRQMSMLAAQATGMPPEAFPWFLGVIGHESNWDPGAKGTAGEIGLGQVMPDTGRALGFSPQDLADPQKNLLASAKYWTQQWNAARGNPDAAMAGYNRGDVSLPPVPAYIADVRRRVLGNGGAQQAGAPSAAPAATPVSAPGAAAPGAPLYQNNTSPLTINMSRPITEELYKGQAERDNKAIGAEEEQVRNMAPTLGDTNLIRGYLPNVATGIGAPFINDMGRALVRLGADENSVKNFTGIDPSQGELLTKNLFNLTATRVRQMGAREPGSLVFAFLKALPNMESRPETIDAMTRAMDMQYQYKLDRTNAMQEYVQNSLDQMQGTQKYRGLNGFDKDFAQTHDPRTYAAAAEAAAGFDEKDWGRGLSDQQKGQARDIAHQVYPDYDMRPGALNGYFRVKAEQQAKQAPAAAAPPQSAIAALKSEPQRAAEFDSKFGQGSAQQYLGGQSAPAQKPPASAPAAPSAAPQQQPVQAAPRQPGQALPQGNPMRTQNQSRAVPGWMAVQQLRNGTMSARNFDALYGQGAAAAALGSK